MSSSGTESDSSASSDVDFDDYGRGSECPTSGNREQPTSERHKLVLMLKMHFTTFAVGMPVLP